MTSSGAPILVVYVDIDDTLIRTAGTKRLPIPRAVEHVRRLHEQGAGLYAWSTGGADYAREVTTELGLAGCFRAFLPKPSVFLDDQPPAAWRRSFVVHPNEIGDQTVESYLRRVRGERVDCD